MARLSYPDIENSSAQVQETFAQLAAPLNIFRMLAHAETCFKPVLRLGGSILGKQKLDGKLRELALLHAVKLDGGEYEWVQHVPIALALGANDAQIKALETGKISAPCFDAEEQAVLRFTGEVVERTGASPEALAAVRQTLSEREVVELIIMIGFYMMMARLTETAGVEIDPQKGTDVIDSIKSRVAARAKTREKDQT